MRKVSLDMDAVVAELERLGVTRGYGRAELAQWFGKLEPELYSYEKGDVILREGAQAQRIGIVLEGAVHVRTTEANGRSVLLHMVTAGSFVGLASVIMAQPHYSISLDAYTDCQILKLSVAKILEWRKEPSSRPFFSEMNRQMFTAMAELMFSCGILRQPRLEDRVLTYLTRRCTEKKSRTVVIPGTEADFADYLGVHSVALSRALRRMKAKGLIDYRRNVLTLLNFNPV